MSAQKGVQMEDLLKYLILLLIVRELVKKR